MQILEETKQTALNLISGQEIDLKDMKINSIDEIDRFYGMKTGSLFSAAAAIGGILGGASETDLVNLRKFGMDLGIAYQYGDDLYDELAPTAFLGKSTGKDKNKNTPVKVLGVAGANVIRDGFKCAAIFSLNSIDKDTKPLESILEDVLSTHKF
jgi:geranylgeranyl pyrophosphate synthase